MVETDRPRGILSKADRELLTGQSEIEPKSQQERNARARIRERIEAGLRDFELLADPAYLEERDLEPVRKASNPSPDNEATLKRVGPGDPVLDQNSEPEISPQITNALIEMVAFTYRVKPQTRFLERVVKVGVRRGLERQDSDAELSDVQIAVENMETVADRVEAYIDKGWSISQWEVTFALKNELRPPEEIALHVQEHGISGNDWEPGNPRHRLPFPAPCPECGGNLDEEGICTECGTETEESTPESRGGEDTDQDA